MDRDLVQLIRSFTFDLSRASLGFLTTGLKEFHDRSYFPHRHHQVALGNLCIGIELLIKAYVATGNLSLIFVDLPVELKTHLVSKGGTKPNVDTKPLEIEFRAGRYKTIEFEPALKLFYAFKPDLKPELDSHTKFLRQFRNRCLHSFIRDSEQFAMDRVAYVALRLLENIHSCPQLGLGRWVPTAEDTLFLGEYEENRVARVEKALADARQQAKTATPKEPAFTSLDWDTYIASCPACNHQALLGGFTRSGSGLAGDEAPDPDLIFVATALYCETCGLRLEDVEELRLAGIKLIHRRPDDYDRWCHDQGPDY